MPRCAAFVPNMPMRVRAVRAAATLGMAPVRSQVDADHWLDVVSVCVEGDTTGSSPDSIMATARTLRLFQMPDKSSAWITHGSISEMCSFAKIGRRTFQRALAWLKMNRLLSCVDAGGRWCRKRKKFVDGATFVCCIAAQDDPPQPQEFSTGSDGTPTKEFHTQSYLRAREDVKSSGGEASEDPPTWWGAKNLPDAEKSVACDAKGCDGHGFLDGGGVCECLKRRRQAASEWSRWRQCRQLPAAAGSVVDTAQGLVRSGQWQDWTPIHRREWRVLAAIVRERCWEARKISIAHLGHLLKKHGLASSDDAIRRLTHGPDGRPWTDCDVSRWTSVVAWRLAQVPRPGSEVPF